MKIQEIQEHPTIQEHSRNDQGIRNTPWGLWSAAGKENKDLHVTLGSISAILDDNRRHKLDR